MDDVTANCTVAFKADGDRGAICWATRLPRSMARNIRSAGSAAPRAGRRGASPTWTWTPRWPCRRLLRQAIAARSARSAHDCLRRRPGRGRGRELHGRQDRGGSLRRAWFGSSGCAAAAGRAGNQSRGWRAARPGAFRRDAHPGRGLGAPRTRPTASRTLCEAAGVPCTQPWRAWAATSWSWP